MKVTLIRHTSVAVPYGTCYGWSDVDVADTFEQEASATMKRLGDRTFDAVYTSPLTRARKLAAFCGYADAVTDDRLKEMNMGEWEMQRWIDITDPHLQIWMDNYLQESTTGGEGFPFFRQRVWDFLDDLRKKSHRHVAVFAHGGVIVCAGLYAGLYPEKEAFSHQVDYGGILEIEI